MPRIILLPPFSDEFFAGKADVPVTGESLFAVIRALDGLAPGFAEAVEGQAAMAVNGVVQADWSARLGADDEIMIVPKVAGG